MGYFQLEPPVPVHFQAGRWKIIWHSPTLGHNSECLWAYRTMKLTVKVERRGPAKEIDPQGVRVAVLGDGEGADSPCHGAFGSSWFCAHHLDRIALPRPDARGVTTAEVPRLPGYQVCAWGQGSEIHPVKKKMPWNEDQTEIVLTLEKPCMMVRGTLETANGVPMAGVVVEGYVIQEMPYDEANLLAIRSTGYMFTYETNRAENKAIVCYLLQSSPTDTEGHFHLASSVRGQLYLTARPLGHWRFPMKDVGNLYSNVDGIDLVVQRDDHMVRITRNGHPLGGERISVVDVTDRRFNPCFEVTLDESGRMTAGGFITDHEYALRLLSDPLVSYFTVFRGESSIELGPLPREPSFVRAWRRKRAEHK